MRKYPFTAKFCANFFVSQNSKEEIDLFCRNFENAPPKYVVMKNEYNSTNAVTSEIIEEVKNNYSDIYSDDTFTLYKNNLKR